MLKRCFHNHQVVNTHTNAIEQTTHYYPYGGIIGNLSSNQETQKYKYSGKALAAIEKIDNLRREREALAEGQDSTYGLDLYDFHARLFNPALPVFDKTDPLAEYIITIHGLIVELISLNNENKNLYNSRINSPLFMHTSEEI